VIPNDPSEVTMPLLPLDPDELLSTTRAVRKVVHWNTW
jgi:hypothetical protein